MSGLEISSVLACFNNSRQGFTERRRRNRTRTSVFSIPRPLPVEANYLELAQKLKDIVSQYRLPYTPALHSEGIEQFTFSTDGKQKYLIIDKNNPRRIQYISFSAYPWHVAFAKRIASNNSGIHRWHIRTTKTTDYLRVGIYFCSRKEDFKRNFGVGRMGAGAESYFAGRLKNVAGIDYRSGGVFGGSGAEIGKIKAGNLTLDLDTANCIMTFRVAERSTTFFVNELKHLKETNQPWESVLWVAIGSGGLRMDHDAEIVSYANIRPRL